jgi:ubiquinone/menaquinone biosynthesis C-methylase UbiE
MTPPKKFVGFENMTAEELFDYNRLEYANSNGAVAYLIRNFYKQLHQIIKPELTRINTVLEIGCGCGESSLRIQSILNKQNHKIDFEASDYDTRFVEQLIKRKYPFSVIQESVYEMKRRDNEFDLVFFLEVLEHLEEPEQAIKELFRVSKKHVLISVPNEPIWRLANMARGKYLKDFGNTPGHLNHYNSNQLIKLVKSWGKPVRRASPFPWTMVLFEK